MTKFEQAFAKMTPAKRKAASKAIGNMMGAAPKRKSTSKKKK